MQLKIKVQRDTLIISIAVIVAVAATVGVACLILDDGSPSVKLAPVSSEAPAAVSVQSQSAVPMVAGAWFRTGVPQEAPATLEISSVTETGFNFQLHARNMTKTGSISGEAYFQQEFKEAKFVNEETGAAIIFTFEDYTIKISHTSNDTSLGCDDTVTYDGTFSTDDPVYTDTSSQEGSSSEGEPSSAAESSSSKDSSSSKSSQSSKFSKDLRKEQLIVNNVKKLMNNADYKLYKNVMTDENIRDAYPESEADTDKNGNKICVDREMNAIKYYAVLSGASTEVILICKPDGKVYVALYEVDEVRYYTNDSKYATKPPQSIKTFAVSRPAPLKCMS